MLSLSVSFPSFCSLEEGGGSRKYILFVFDTIPRS
jgi:hypothetical protein